MDRRLFLFVGSAWALNAFSEPPVGGWKPGVNYETLSSIQPISSRAGGLADVVEAFSYTCIHCFRLEPYILAWRKKQSSSVRLTRLPSQWDERHLAHARLYRTLQSLGRNDLDEAVFEAIHIKKNPLFSDSNAETLNMQTTFVTSHGIDGARFKQAYASDAVTVALKRDAEALMRFQIAETPAVVVDAKYMTDVSHVKTPGDRSEDAAFESLLQLAEYLINLSQRGAHA
jgi:thiol:disulfide interchange protein DsbA